MMRLVLVLAAAATIGCSQPQATAPAVEAEAAPAPLLSAAMLTGVWSFDRSCASGDAMALYADGTATYDEWGDGRWRLGEDGALTLDLAIVEPGVLEPPADAPRTRILITAHEAASEDHLRGVRVIEAPTRGEAPIAGRVEIDALKCPTAPPSP